MTPRQKPMASKLGRPVSFDREEALEQAMRVFWGAVLRQKGQRASKECRRSIHHRARSHRPVELALHTGSKMTENLAAVFDRAPFGHVRMCRGGYVRGTHSPRSNMTARFTVRQVMQDSVAHRAGKSNRDRHRRTGEGAPRPPRAATGLRRNARARSPRR